MRNSAVPESPAILIIASRGLRFFVQALSAYAALRMHHSEQEIHLVTDKELVPFADLSPYFDNVSDLPATAIGLARRLRSRVWDTVYDFNGSRMTAWARRIAYGFGAMPSPVWSAPPQCTSSRAAGDPGGNNHVSDRLLSQIEHVGVLERPPASLAWVSRAANSFSVPFSLDQKFVLISVDGPRNSQGWSNALLGECCALIESRGQLPVLIGRYADARRAEQVVGFAPATVDMTGGVTLEEIVFMAWAALGAIGYDNDTMHLVAAAGCRSILLYDPTSDAALTGHRGPDVTILRRHKVDAIAPIEAVQKLYVKAVA